MRTPEQPNAACVDAEHREPLYRLKNVQRRFGVRAIKFDELEIQSARVTCVLGSSGSGKSTLLSLLGGLSRPNSNLLNQTTGARTSTLEVNLTGARGVTRFDLFRDDLANYKRHIGFVFQSPFLIQDATASANIAVGAAAAGMNVTPDEIRALCEELQIDPKFLFERCRNRSGGERQRIALARALSRRPSIILADEPTANLDPLLASDVVDALKRWISGGPTRSVVWVTHDVHLAAEFADDIVVLRDGQLANGADWPKANPTEASTLREWISGRTPIRGRLASVPPQVQATLANNEELDAFRAQAKPHGSSRVWMKIGVSQILNGPAADHCRRLQLATSVSLPLDYRETHLRAADQHGHCNWLRLYGAISGTVRTTLLIVLLLMIWVGLDAIILSVQGSMHSPTLNPVVISSRERIDSAAIVNLQQQIKPAGSELPVVFGRYEFDNRRVALPVPTPQTGDEEQCETARGVNEIALDMVAVDPGEPMLQRLDANAGRTVGPHVSTALRFVSDHWNVLIAKAAKQRVVTLLGAEPNFSVVCIEVGGRWLTAHVFGQLEEPPRGRHGPYDIVLSASRWRDFGQAEDRESYETAAVYFGPDTAEARAIVGATRQRASVEPGTSRSLLRSLIDSAAFERIAALLDKAEILRSALVILALCTCVFLLVTLANLVSDDIEKNAKAYAVVEAVGGGLRAIAAIEATRLTLILCPALLLSALILSATVGAVAAAALETELNLGASVLYRGALLAPSILASALLLAVMMTARWRSEIRRRGISEALKQVD